MGSCKIPEHFPRPNRQSWAIFIEAHYKVMSGRRVKTLRQKLGMTQEELAHRAHLHRNYVSLLERGHRGISLNTILEVAKALGVKPAKLFNW